MSWHGGGTILTVQWTDFQRSTMKSTPSLYLFRISEAISLGYVTKHFPDLFKYLFIRTIRICNQYCIYLVLEYRKFYILKSFV